MSTPAAKRRRIEAMHTAVSQPFRSPFKGPHATSTSTPTNNFPLLTPSTAPVPCLALPSPLLPSPPTTKPTPPAHTPRLALRAISTDPAIAPILKTQRQLESQLRDLQDQVNTAKQAARIEQASERWSAARQGPRADAGARPASGELEIDGELRDLVEKWRAASRMAAEELFGGVRDRVNRMGGPLAFKLAQKAAAQRQREFQAEWNEAPPVGDGDEDGERGEGEERDLYADYGDVETETENERRERAGEEPGADVDDEEFSMAIMLRTLNVDLKVIGYDREMQKWTD